MIRSHRKTIYETLGRDSVHPFPARMAPGIALEVVSESKTPIRVLDPMMGSGTVLAMARSKGHRSTGLDIDPLAVLISRVWTTAIDPAEVRDKAAEVLDRARLIFKKLRVRDAYPRRADQETRDFTAFWFDGYARRQLTALSRAIGRVRDDATRDVLWCGFSRLIISKQSGASLAMDMSHSRPHKVFATAPSKPFRKFIDATNLVVKNCIRRTTENRGPAPCIHEGDARDLPLADDSIDLVLTSPPYLNAIDYIRCSKFSLIWMGHSIASLRSLRTESVGTESSGPELHDDGNIREIMKALQLRPELPAKNEAIIAHYVDDMSQAVREVSRVLVPGGKAVYVVGENTVRGTYIPNSEIVTAVADSCGLSLEKRNSRALPKDRRYLPAPSQRGSAAMDGRIRREVVLGFIKKAA